MKITARILPFNFWLGGTNVRLTSRHLIALCTSLFVLLVFYLAIVLRNDHWLLSDGWGFSKPGNDTTPVVGDKLRAPKTSPEEWARRAGEVRKAFFHAYSSYEQNAFPHDELQPLSKEWKDNFNGWGVTVFDALDTMIIMGLHDEFSRALSHVAQVNFTIQRNLTTTQKMNIELSFFETVIRYLGGLLSAYSLSHEPILLQRAAELADILDPVFDDHSGLPWQGFSVLSGRVRAVSAFGMLAEVGSCQLEFATLGRLTGKRSYYDRAAKIFENFRKVNLTQTGMIPMKLNLISGVASDTSVSVGGGADSAHEYLLKYYLMTGQKDASSLNLYMHTINHILTNMTYISPRRSLIYVTDLIGNISPSHRFEHLSCFLPGLLALGIHTLPASQFRPSNETFTFTSHQSLRLSSYNLKDLHLWLAKGLGETCWQMYADEPSGLGPEVVTMSSPPRKGDPVWKPPPPEEGLWINKLGEWKASGSAGLPPGLEEKETEREAYRRDYQVMRPEYLLRPETIESMYLLWKATGDERWRERGWAIFQAIEKQTRINGGYATLRTVEVANWEVGNDMPSFFFAETLKYLYLLFLDEDPLPLNKWVFNTEAHPLPIFDWSPWEKHKFGIV